MWFDFSEASGETDELEDCLVMGGVVSLFLDNEEDPVESFLATFAMISSPFDVIGAAILVGDIV